MTSMFDATNPEQLHADQKERLHGLRIEQARLAQLAEAGYIPPSPRARIAALLLRLAFRLDARIVDIHQPANLRHA